MSNRVRQWDERELISRCVRHLRWAAEWFVHDGSPLTGRLSVKCCRLQVEELGVVVMFTRDAGHHACGWWKNPDYERCYHLSLSFFDPVIRCRLPRNKGQTALWLDAFYGHHRQWLWCEPPYSPEGKAADVWHYRLFCNPAWEPSRPRGEVYSRKFTELGWKSWSDVQADLQAASIRIQERIVP